MTPGLFAFLTKHAADEASKLQPKPAHQNILDTTFSSHEQSRWRDFRRALRSKSFVDAVKADDRADPKMKRYAEAMYLHATGKGESFTVPGTKKNHTVKFHPKLDRFTCSCPDWGYSRSHQPSKTGQDCKHIKMVKMELQSRGEKTAMLGSLAGTAGMLHRANKFEDRNAKERSKVLAYKSVFRPIEHEQVKIAARGRAAAAIKEYLGL